ncbi:MAG: DUF2946 domain-containing protein [Burkholderiaceae bacterium]|nr:DUF2946 domain-containing protein [Burkholderiaceae bacterium]
MKRTPATRAQWLWIACCAILLNALAPTVSHAIAFARGVPASWEICRADGSRVTVSGQITSIGERGEAPGATNIPGMDCAYCQTHAGSFGLPPVIRASLPVQGSHAIPFLFYRAPQPRPVWASAQPRGPPASC